jgi:hypothetical protein
MAINHNFEAEAKELIQSAVEYSGLVEKVAALLERGVSGSTIPWLIDKFEEITIPCSYAEWAESISGGYGAYVINTKWKESYPKQIDLIAASIAKEYPDVDVAAAMREGFALIVAPDEFLKHGMEKYGAVI